MKNETCVPSSMHQGLVSKANLRLLVIFAAIFFIIHGSWLFNFFGTVDDVMPGEADWVILARGKWAAWLFKTALSNGANYPYGGIFCGLAMAAAAVLQCRALNLLHTWQQVAYATLLFSSYQEVDNISWWMQSDTCALGILAASATTYSLSRAEGRKWLYAIPLLTTSLGCYQTLGVYFFILFLVILTLHYFQGRMAEARQFFIRGAIITPCALMLYFVINKCLTPLVPECYEQWASSYEEQLTGWKQFSESDSTGMFWQLINYGVAQPLLRFMTLSGGRWLYVSSLLPVFGLAVHFVRCKRYKNAAAIAVLGAVTIYLPFLFALLLLNQTGFTDRMMNAVPVCTACLWGTAFILVKGHFIRHAHAYGTILVLVSVQALYLSGVAARNRMFGYERCIDELHDMYLLARVEAAQHGMNNCDIVFCGIVPKPKTKGADSLNSSNESALNVVIQRWQRIKPEDSAKIGIFQRWQGTDNHYFKIYSQFYGFGARLRYAQEDELKRHSQKLHCMPIWPADGSVAADGGVVLIKLGNEMEVGKPLP